MKSVPVIIACVLLSIYPLQSKIVPTRLTCEYLINPSVIDVTNPRLSWINIADAGERGQYQTAWEIKVADSKEALLSGKSDLWNSGKVLSDQSVNVRYAGKPLASRQDCWWQVRVWDKKGKVSEWSEPAFWAMGFLDPAEWKAKWIGAPWEGEEPMPDSERPLTASRAKPDQKITDISAMKAPSPAPMLRKRFLVKDGLVSAKAYVTGLGYFELYLNGNKVGNDVLVPNQTNYGKRPGLMNKGIPIPDNFQEYRVMYLAYDLKDLLKEGENAIGAILGNGFYNAPINWTESYGTPRFICQIHLYYSDGSTDIILSDQTWKVAKSPILMDLIYDGEHYDARREINNWCSPEFDDSEWENATLRKSPEGKMKAHMAYPDRIMESLEPVKIEKLSEGRYKVDFGQEISGWVHLKNLIGEAGRRIDIKYLHLIPSGDNSYTLKGGGPESYRARFTWFVFREVEISGWPGELRTDQINAEAVYTWIETSGRFECSNPLLNNINKIWWRSQADNMHGGIASDCPNRERSPYTGDGQVACVTVMHNFDARAFYNKWIHDIIGAYNNETGYVPNGAPWQPGCGGGVAWGAAISIMPWEFYLHYGDTAILWDSFGAMKGYVGYMLKWTDNDGIMFSQVIGPDGKPNKWMNLGEWVAPYELPADDLVHTFYLWRCADIASKTAEILGQKSDALKYAAIAEKTRKAFMDRFYDEAKGSYGKYGGNIFALRMGVPEERKAWVVEALKADIISNGGHLDTGIFGTQFFFEVLAENGLNNLAYEAISKSTMPGYGWWISEGSTTSWEYWDKPGSGNHPMFGGGLVWLYRKLAGMSSDPDMPGFRKIIFRPMPVGEISSASYSNMTPYGESGISWEKNGTKLIMDVTIPVGSKAEVYIPCSDIKKIREGGRRIKTGDLFMLKGRVGEYNVIEILNGKYHFETIFN